MHTITVRSLVTVRFLSTIGEEETALAALLDNLSVTNFKLSSTDSIPFLFSSTTYWSFCCSVKCCWSRLCCSCTIAIIFDRLGVAVAMGDRLLSTWPVLAGDTTNWLSRGAGESRKTLSSTKLSSTSSSLYLGSRDWGRINRSSFGW